MSEVKCEFCSAKSKERSEKEYKDLLNRLSRIEGQVRGVKAMVERDAYCTDIITQVSAINSALNSFNKVLLANHIKTCVTQDIKSGKEETYRAENKFTKRIEPAANGFFTTFINIFFHKFFTKYPEEHDRCKTCSQRTNINRKNIHPA